MIDTHAHLMFPEFEEDRAQVVERAREAGLTAVINVGCGREASMKSLEMADGKFLFPSVGLHPYDAEDVSEDLMREWESLLKARSHDNKRVVAIGETGLDYFKSKVDPEKQKKSFRMHLELAQHLDLPVIVHNRGSDQDVLSLLREFPNVRAVFHCFGSSLDFARVLWASGYLTSFTGIITYPSAQDLRKVVAEAPKDLFMVETDCPYLAPQSHRGERNEPSYVVEVVEKVAELKAISFEDSAALSTSNAKSFFGLS